jgi:hypothetical protein
MSKKVYRIIRHDDAERITSSLPTDGAKEALRELRERECFSIINRGQLWYESLTDEQRADLSAWYRAWLDCTSTMLTPKRPTWLTEGDKHEDSDV